MALPQTVRVKLSSEVAEAISITPVVVQELTRQIKRLKTMGLTILFAEQNMHFAAELSDRAYVIEKGRIRFHGSMQELAANEEVKAKYLMI